MFALGRPPASACGTNFASCAAKAKRPQLTIADRTIMAALSQRMSRAAQVGMLVQPETVLGWHRELVRRKWADNPRWGCVRIRGELLKLGHRVSATAIRKLLRKTRLGRHR